MADDTPAWPFYCGVCCTPLTDATALFTSCGHFFCAENPSCTRLTPSTDAGRCEQCSNQCNARILENKGSKYDEKVRSFVFKRLPRELNMMAEILNFRDKHLSILAQNAYALAKRVHKLEAANATQSQENRAQEAENGKLRTELAALRAQNARLNQTSHPTHLAATLQPSRPSHRPSSSVLGGSSTHVDATRTNDSLRNPIRQRQSHGDPSTMPDSTLESTQYGVQQASPSRFTNILHGVRTRDQPGSIAKLPRRHLEIERGNTRQAVASSLNAAAVRQSKRRREGRPTPPALTLKRSRRIPPPALVPKRASRAQPSVVAASRAQRSAPRFTSSKPTATAELSRFARGAGSNSIRGNLLRGTSTQQPGDWQRRVSSVPRPSATPDRLGKNAQRRNRHGSNPLARW